jgi:CubicO group peptidase (beta-lactamase class C family)
MLNELKEIIPFKIMQQRKIILFILLVSINHNMFSQSIPDSTLAKINHIFSKWDSKTSPGCVVGIIKNDSLIFAKGYGMANLEYDIANTPNTLYHMASVSKQFTAYCILLLAKQGKLNLDDDIRNYLPSFPDLKEKITIRHLLNHTSGIRDQWALLNIAGTRQDDVITQDHILKILSKQQALNFKPNEDFSYSNSGYTLLAEIIKSVSGESLRAFADAAIFKPLQMTHTFFHDDYNEIIKNRASSYSRNDSTHFSNCVLSYSTIGATGLYTTMKDMSKWIQNFYTIKAGDKTAIHLLTDSKPTLANGKSSDYAFGITNERYHGKILYKHGGADAGYRNMMYIFPTEKMGFVIFSNLADIPVAQEANELADLFIQDKDVIRKSKKKRSTAQRQF